MVLLILTCGIIALSLVPQLWVRYTLRKHAKPLPNMPGTGGELAQHLIERFELKGVQLEASEAGADHYDPADKVVRLSPEYLNGRSLTAVAVAAHEVGHAIQYHRQEPISMLRSKYIPLSFKLQKAGTMVLLLMPVITGITKAPAIFTAAIALSLILQLAAALLYLWVLPEEWDASFNKAMPILKEGGYLPEEYQQSVQAVLKAAALTYFAGALANILNVGRWFLVLREDVICICHGELYSRNRRAY